MTPTEVEFFGAHAIYEILQKQSLVSGSRVSYVFKPNSYPYDKRLYKFIKRKIFTKFGMEYETEFVVCTIYFTGMFVPSESLKLREAEIKAKIKSKRAPKPNRERPKKPKINQPKHTPAERKAYFDQQVAAGLITPRQSK